MTEQNSQSFSVPGTLKPFLGNPMEICVVTKDYKRTISSLHNLGIGPWRIYRFSPSNTTNQTYNGTSSAFEGMFCFAEFQTSGGATDAAASNSSPTNMVYEVIQPVSGPSIFQDFLDEHGEGIHHIAYDCNNVPFEDRLKEFKDRGFKLVQGGSFMGRNHFAFFTEEGQDRTGTCFETYEFPSDWEYPEPEEWYPPKKSA
ncbi:hypothetical protein PVAG01_07465 [Phlyctema vagabunda]|uniref:VOC domain-containing protein n=1 Tax=Phlyctema vagabunda TaxID=108571 RepID=A0ABR4PCH0_9HELO